jgi:hypothetical protein
MVIGLALERTEPLARETKPSGIARGIGYDSLALGKEMSW